MGVGSKQMPVSRRVRLLEPVVRLSAEIVHGFGRGSTKLGFPTANLAIRRECPADELSTEEVHVLRFVEDHDTGVYCGFASIQGGPKGTEGVFQVAMNMGWNPTFDDVPAKTIEPWLPHDFDQSFYGAH